MTRSSTSTSTWIWAWTSLPSQTTALGQLASLHPIPPRRRDRQQYPCPHDNPIRTPSTQLYHSSSHKHRKAAATHVTLMLSLRGRRTKGRSGRGGKRHAESSRASGSGGIGKRSRAGGDGVEANVLNDYTAMLTTAFFALSPSGDAKCNGVDPFWCVIGTVDGRSNTIPYLILSTTETRMYRLLYLLYMYERRATRSCQHQSQVSRVDNASN